MAAAETNHNPEALPLTILVVEDEVLVRITTAEELRLAGSTVVEAASGAEALKVLQASVHIDLLFTDVHMPGTIDGLALAAQARRLFPSLKVMVTSAHVPAWPSPGLADEFVGKPYAFHRLIARIKTLLAND